MASTVKSFKEEMGSATITYLKVPKIEEYHSSYRPHDMEFGAHWFWGHCIDVKGNTYFWVREILKDYAGFLFYFKATPGSQVPDDQIFKDDLFKGYILNILDRKNETVTIRPQFEEGASFNIVIEKDKIHMEDASGKVKFEYEELPAPCQEWYCPGQYGTMDDTMYRSKHYTVTGEIDGVKIAKGWGGLDTEWGPVGCPTRMYKRYDSIEKIFIVWYTEYEDGTVEDGVLVRGYGDHVSGWYYRDGKAYIPKDIHIEPEVGEGGALAKAVIYFDDMTFDFGITRLIANDVCALDDGQESDAEGGDMAWTAGVVTNRAIKSPVVAGWSTPEFKAKDVIEDPIRDMRKPITFEEMARGLE